MTICAAYIKHPELESPERDELLAKHPTPAEYSTFFLFCETHPNPVDAIDCTKTIDGESEYSTDDLIALISTHTTAQAVHVTLGQANTIYELLYTSEEDI